jgi:hypothetical protein
MWLRAKNKNIVDGSCVKKRMKKRIKIRWTMVLGQWSGCQEYGEINMDRCRECTGWTMVLGQWSRNQEYGEINVHGWRKCSRRCGSIVYCVVKMEQGLITFSNFTGP